jgi:GT2 family glycosyltransferase
MLARRDAVDAVGQMDERFFLYCEETDLCLRMRKAGWSVAHLPEMTIFHQSSSEPGRTLTAQMAFARRQYLAKHFGRAHRIAMMLALSLGYAIRSFSPGRGANGRRRRAYARLGLATLLGAVPPPFGHESPPGVSTPVDHRPRPS